jgi:branched-chain amino acid aminotransferase
MNFICLDGRIVAADEPVLHADNRGFRYGDGLFETMKVIHGSIILGSFHFERLMAGVQILDYVLPVHFSETILHQIILELIQKNKCGDIARVRLTLFRGRGGLYDENKKAGYLIECWPLNDAVNALNENGLVIDIFPGAEKSCDRYANLKSASFLPYSIAAQYAKKQQLNECLVLNTKGNIADGSITNLFVIKSGNISTPSLTEGCIAGVMRRHLLHSLKEGGYTITESSISPDDLSTADEVFLTNAIQGIKWVKAFRDKTYTHTQTQQIYNEFVRTIFS